MATVLLPDVERAIAALGSEVLLEIVDGQVVEKSFPGVFERSLASFLGYELEDFASPRRSGKASVEMLFDLHPAFDRKRRPHVAFISVERWPLKRRVPGTEAWAVIPDLVVEILGSFNKAIEVLNKVDEYFRAGVRRVWVVYSNLSQVYAYDSIDSVRIFGPGTELDGGLILPEFRLSISELFGEP